MKTSGKSCPNEVAKQWIIQNATCEQLVQFIENYRSIKQKEKNKKCLHYLMELIDPGADFVQCVQKILLDQAQKKDKSIKKLNLKKNKTVNLQLLFNY